MMKEFVLHWGCRDRPGHYLTFPNGGSLRDIECDRLMVPRGCELDGTFLFLPRPETRGSGALTYLPATDRTILAWWDGTFDGRGGCNMAIIVSGKATTEECWRRFVAAFPKLAAKLTTPTVVAAPADEQKIRGDERKRIAGILEEAADQAQMKPDSDPERIDVMRSLARTLRIDTEELIIVALEQLIDEIRAEEAAGKLVFPLTADSHPHLFEAFETISHDSGGRAGHSFYNVPSRFVAHLPEAEATLATLSADDLSTFCIGECSEIAAIAARSPELARTGDLLAAFFDGWVDERDNAELAP